MNSNFIKYSTITIFIVLYAIVSVISTIHVIDFFGLSNPRWLAVSLAIAFEFGAAASLCSLVILDKLNKNLVWFIFILLTLVQINGNIYYAYSHLHDYNYWIELFGLVDYELIAQKRILAIISGAILPIIALGFIKSLIDYIKPDNKEIKTEDKEIKPDDKKEEIKELISQQTNKPTKDIIAEESIPEGITKIPEVESGQGIDVIIDDLSENNIEQSINEIPIEDNKYSNADHIQFQLDDIKKRMSNDTGKTDFEKELDNISSLIKQENNKSTFEKELDRLYEDNKANQNKNKVNSNGRKIIDMSLNPGKRSALNNFIK